MLYIDSKLILKKKNEEKTENNNNINNHQNIIFHNSTQTKMSEIPNKMRIKKEQIVDTLKPRSLTFDSKKQSQNNYPIKLNIGNLHLIGTNTVRNNINILGNNENTNENKKNIFLNTNKLPKIVTRLSLSNFHKNSNNNNDIGNIQENNNKGFPNKFNIFNKTSGSMGFKGLTFNSGLAALRNTNYKCNNINNLNSCKILNPNKDIFKGLLSKEQMVSPNNTNYKNIIQDMNKIKNLQFNKTNINDIKNKKNLHINKNTFNKKTIIHNNNKYFNNLNINQVNNNIVVIFKNNKKDKDDTKEKQKGKENEEKNNLCEENNDSFINELNDLFSNVKENNDSINHFQENIDENNKNNESDDDDDDKEPDPRINFEQINRVNKSRPQTSYGGLNARRKNLQSAIQNERNKKNRPTTSNIPE